MRLLRSDQHAYIEKLIRIFLLSLSCFIYCTSYTHAQTNSSYTFQELYPAFLKTRIVPAYAQYESSISPATFDADNGDFHSEFVSPSGRQVTITVKAPVVAEEYNVPAISLGQTV